jgi:putative flippase GtrA
MKIVRDGSRFIAVGCVLVAVDTATFITLTKLGVLPPVANVCGRIMGALLGFWLNGRFTFNLHRQPLLGNRFARYLLMWISTTTVSTASLTWIARHASLTQAWWSKPLIEIGLGVISFAVARHWVYRQSQRTNDAVP